MIAIEPLQPDDLEELLAYVQPVEQDLLQRWPAIPAPAADALLMSLQDRVQYGPGLIARDAGHIVGVLQTVGPFEDFRPGSSGVYGPLMSCLVSGDQPDRLFTTLLTELGNLPQLTGTSIAAFTCLPHHTALSASLTQNGFGVRCADSVVAIDDLPTELTASPFSIEEVHWREAVTLVEIKESLASHLATSPMYMEHFQFTPEFVAWKSEERESVHIVARDGERIVGFIEATYEGENYLTRSPHMRNICGAGVLPEYRGRGIMRTLLIHLANRYRAEGITTLGVDYETFNPNARGFWESWFTPYTWSWERKFDFPWGSS